MRATRRLEGYWRMEALNVLLLPVISIVIVLSLRGRITLGLMAAMVANSFLLGIGAAYWRAWTLRRAQGQHWFERTVTKLAICQPVALALIVVAVILLVREWHMAHRWVTPVTGWVVWTISVLEYVNYYVVQLQHFDHATDMKRLMAGRGFRRAHLARDIARMRRQRRETRARPR